jgi:hypothetical protein
MTSYTFVDPPNTQNPSSVVFAPSWNDRQRNSTYGVGIINARGALTMPGAAGEGQAFCAIAFHWAQVRRQFAPCCAASHHTLHCVFTIALTASHLQVVESALPRFADSIVAVLRSPSGKQFTFSVSGREVTNVGGGDLHAQVHGLHAYRRTVEVSVAGTSWSLNVYPTPQARTRSVASSLAFHRVQRCLVLTLYACCASACCSCATGM